MPLASAVSDESIDTPRSCGVFLSEASDRLPFVFERFERFLAGDGAPGQTAGRLRLERLEPPVKSPLEGTLDGIIARAVLFVVDVTPRVVADEACWSPNVSYALGRLHQAQVPVFVLCDGRFRSRSGRASVPWDLDAASLHWYEFTPDGLTVATKAFGTWMASGQVQTHRNWQSFIGAAGRAKGTRAPRRATDLQARMTLGNRDVVGRVTSLSSSGAFFVPGTLPGTELPQAQPTRLILIRGRKTEQLEVELRRVGPTGDPNAVGFGVRFVRAVPRPRPRLAAKSI